MSMDEFLRSQTARRFFDDFSKLAHAVYILAEWHEKPNFDKPRYRHEAPSATAFLGQWQRYDLYYMPMANGTDIYLARHGDHPNDMHNSEMMAPPVKGAPGGWIIALKIAQFIAKELELQKPRTRKAILSGEQSER